MYIRQDIVRRRPETQELKNFQPSSTRGRHTQHCGTCGRCCKSVRGYQLHNCSRQCHRPTASQREAFTHQRVKCQKKFRRRNDLTRHQRSCSCSSTPLNWGHVAFIGSVNQDQDQVCVFVCAWWWWRGWVRGRWQWWRRRRRRRRWQRWSQWRWQWWWW